jgi:Bacterial transcriptional activator domain/NB-ARC domain
MRALYAAAGRPAEALERFERIRTALAESLGVDPGPFLRDTHRAILWHEPPAHEPAAQNRTVPAQLPTDLLAFTGRATELARLDEITKPTATAPTIVCVTGPAGSGKSGLAIHVGQMMRDRFPDGQSYVNLRGYDPDPPVGADEALAGLLAWLALGDHHLPSDVDFRAARYRSALAGRRILVVLDNASTAEQVRPLLPGSAGCAVLVTSRDSLAGLVAVHSARRIVLGPMPREDSTALLRTLIDPAADHEPDAVHALARRCDDLPLALCVAAELASRRATAELVRRRAGTPLASLATERVQLVDLDDRGHLVRGRHNDTGRLASDRRRGDLRGARARLRQRGGHDGQTLAVADPNGCGVQQPQVDLRRLHLGHSPIDPDVEPVDPRVERGDNLAGPQRRPARCAQHIAPGLDADTSPRTCGRYWRTVPPTGSSGTGRATPRYC